MSAPVEMGLKADAVIADASQRAKAEDLKPTAVGQYWTVPPHKTVEPAKLRDRLVSRSQKKMIGVAQQNLDFQLSQLIRRHRLHGRLCADRHEDWCLDHSAW